ncbi:hypothetical protein CTEN210_08994 [Chaetoceros tenuissimus]|uniref:G-protein coupled receptors family 1 profile domain-containing protein n=1 Tax=Chaetoceros tenuissimus TaxID=426638 RepID=A0AAD3H769_9STRA|nr:hypothetical protein CTEN210_08994 [Chaetoceros tenuissimus]
MNSTNTSVLTNDEDPSSWWLENNSNTTVQHVADYFYYSKEATIMTCTSGALSTLSSLFIILIILRSREFLFSSYHRIMFFMSISDMVASAPITLATLPMPKDVLYPFATLTLGNKNTCTAQAFTILFGQVCAVLSNLILNLYYLFKIRYNKSENFIEKKLEPIGYTLSVTIGLIVVFTALAKDMLLPVPDWPLCYTGSTYPWNCLGNDEVECIAGDISQTEYTVFKSFFFGLMGFVFVMVLISLILVVLSVSKTRKLLADTRKAVASTREALENSRKAFDNFRTAMAKIDEESVASSTRSQQSLQNKQESGVANTHSVLKVALMYIGAFILTYGWTVLSVAVGSFNQWGFMRYFLDRAKLIFNPAQGFFNLLIFLYNKVHILRESRKEALSFCQALKIVIFNPREVPEFLIPSLDVVDKDITKRERERKAQKAIIDVEQHEDLMLGDFALSSVSTPSGHADVGRISSGLAKNSILSKKISDLFSQEVDAALAKDQSFHRNISIREDLFSVETPDSVFAASSRNNDDLSYMSKSFGIASEGNVSHSASTVKR